MHQPSPSWSSAASFLRALQRRHVGFDPTGLLWWDIDGFARRFVAKRRPGGGPEATLVPLQKLKHLDQRAVQYQAIGLDQAIMAELQGIPVEGHLLRRG